MKTNRLPMGLFAAGGSLVAAVCILGLLCGCGGRQEASVSGVVTLNGSPLTTGDVAFHRIDGGALAYGRIKSDGAFALSTGSQNGLKSGEYVVTVVSATEPSHGLKEVPGKLLTPVKYGDVKTSPLRVVVSPGPNRTPLELK